MVPMIQFWINPFNVNLSLILGPTFTVFSFSADVSRTFEEHYFSTNPTGFLSVLGTFLWFHIAARFLVIKRKIHYHSVPNWVSPLKPFFFAFKPLVIIYFI